MNKVAVIGCPGAGKSTFARKLAGITGLPVVHLDMLWHLPDGSHVSREEFTHSLDILLARDRFIMDGNYLNTLPARLEVCDTVFFLDYPLSLCLEGAQTRIGKKREDMPWVETCFDPEFREYIKAFPSSQRPEILRLLEVYGRKRASLDIFVFSLRAQADGFLDSLAAGCL